MLNVSRAKCLVRILSAGAIALSVARKWSDTMTFGLVLNIDSNKCVARILPAGTMALSVARISADTMKHGLVYAYKQY